MTVKKITKIQTDTADPEDLLEFISHQIYQSLADLHTTLAASVGEEQANKLVINALSVNLGHIIGQFDVKNQKKYANLTKQLIKEYTLLGTMEKDRHLHGKIGHA